MTDRILLKKTILIIGGSILQIPLIEETHKMGFNVICSDIDSECVCKDSCDTFWQIDIYKSKEHVLAAIKLLEEQNTQLIGCVAAGIDAIETAHLVNEWIFTQTKGKHGFWANWKATTICRNKYKFRMWQKENGFNYPQYSNEPPFIIKPVDNSGGRGITLFRNYTNPSLYIDSTNKAIESSKIGNIIMEELLDGTEHTVETIWENGIMYPAFITDRYFKDDDNYAIESGASHPSSLPQNKQDGIYAEINRLGQTLGMKYGPLKGDIIIVQSEEICPQYDKSPGHYQNCDNCDGYGNMEKIYILEATTRYSGGFDCQYLVPMATGKNILKAAIQCNVYGKFDKDLLKAKWDKHSMIGSPWPREGIIKSIEFFPEQGEKMIEYMKDSEGWLFLNSDVGDKIKYVDSTSRVAFLIVSRETRLEAVRAMKYGLENLKVEIE